VEQIKKHSRPGEPERQVLGLIYLKQGKIDASIAELDLIVTAWPKDHKSRYYLATAYEEKGDNDKALAQFKLIDQKSKYYQNAQMHIIHLLILEEKFDDALKALEQLMAMDRSNTDLYLMLAAIYEAQEKYDEAIDAVKEGLTLDEKNINLRFRLGVLLDKAGRKEACIQEMQQLLKIDPDNADALNYIGYTYAEQGVRLDEALLLIQKALKLKPDGGYIIDSLGWVYFQKGEYEKALETLLKAAALAGEDPTVQEHLGDAHFKLKQYQKALQSYEKALSLKHPEETRIKEKIAEVRERLKTEN
jgi:tetratricopeptide (TPR) repeat protein